MTNTTWKDRFGGYRTLLSKLDDLYATDGNKLSVAIESFIETEIANAVSEREIYILEKIQQYKSYYNPIEDIRNRGKHAACEDIISLITKK